MMLLRQAQGSDIDAIHTLAMNSGVGITTLPQDKNALIQRIERAVQSFNPTYTLYDHAYYLFVLENTETKALVGTSAIEARSGADLPFYTYHVSTHHQTCEKLRIKQNYTLLSLSNETEGLSELCTLFLNPDDRKDGNGPLLSRARFLFMANHPERFTSRLIAEIRGVSDEQGCSPFWDALGYHFFKCSFAQAVALNAANMKQAIVDFMPKYPIYADLLPQKAQDVIGQPHASSHAAMTILLHEGFRYNQCVDLFDAGPTIEVQRDACRSIANSQPLRLTITDASLTSPTRAIIANTSENFRACLATVELNKDNGTCVLHQHQASMLDVVTGDTVRVVL
ncbi:MAG: arginine N-succinyltransferase [Legionellaceae bacterium]